MNNGINLLAKKKNNNTGFLFQKLRVLRIIAVCLLFIVSVLSVILFILIALSPLPKLKQQEQESKINLSHFNSDIVKLQFLNDRLNIITDILSKRPGYNIKIDLLMRQMPDGLIIKSLNLEKNTISIGVSSKSLISIDTFLNNLINLSGDKKEFFSITINSLAQDDKDNSFNLDVSILSYE